MTDAPKRYAPPPGPVRLPRNGAFWTYELVYPQGMEPTPAVRRMHERFLRRDPTLRAPKKMIRR